MFLLDTDVLSALRNRRRYPSVESWIARQRAADLYISVISIGEIERGIALERRRDAEFASRLAAWLDQVLVHYSDRLLAFDLASSRRWGLLGAKLGNASPDLQIASTALEHGLTVATRNVSDFGPTGVATINPFEAGRRR